MKRFAFITLLSAVLFQAGGLFLVCKFQQIKIQLNALEILKSNSDNFIKLNLSKPEFDKSKINGHEIMYKGILYDIKSVVEKDNLLELTVISDEAETSLIQKITALATNSNNSNKNAPINFIKLLSVNYLCPSLCLKYMIFNQTHVSISTHSPMLKSLQLDSTSPPPRLA